MATAGPNYPGTAVNDASVGTRAWADPGNITASDNLRATTPISTTNTTNYLKATNFGFAIPAGSTINGIQVDIERRQSPGNDTSNSKDGTVKLVIGDVVSGDNLGDLTTNWPSVEATKTYGGPTTLWGLTPSASDVNGSTFGVVLSTITNVSNSEVDGITITVDYTTASRVPSSQSMQPFLAQ